MLKLKTDAHNYTRVQITMKREQRLATYYSGFIAVAEVWIWCLRRKKIQLACRAES